MRKEAEDLALSKKDLETRLEASRAEAELAKGRAEDLERRMDEATKAGSAASVANAELKGELSTLQASYRALELASSRLTKEAEEHEEDAARTRSALAEAERELQQGQTRARELERRLEQGQKEAELMKEQKETLQASMASLREQVASDKTRIEFMETTIAAGGDNSKALTEEVKRLEAARQLEKDSREACERELYVLRGQYGDVKARLEAVDVELRYAHDASMSDGDIARKQSEAIKHLEASVQTLSSELETSRVLQIQLETRLVAENEKKAELSAQLAETSSQLASSQSHHQLLQGALTDWKEKSAADKARIELMEIWESCSRSEPSRASIEKILEGAVHETERLRTALIEAEAKKEASAFKVRDLEGQNAALAKQNHTLRQEVQNQEVQSASYKKKIVELEAQVDNITTLVQKIYAAPMQAHFRAPALPLSPNSAADVPMQQLKSANAKLVSENSALKAQVQALHQDSCGNAARLAELEAVNDDLRGLTHSLQIRMEKASDNMAEAQAENDRLASLLQEADKAAMQLERQTGRLAESQQKIRDQDGRIAQLLAEIKELKAQVKYLTKQLEMAVEDLETEAKQTERFTNTFFDWSQRFNDGSNGNRSGSVEKTGDVQQGFPLS